MELSKIADTLNNKIGTSTVFSFRINDAVYAIVKEIAKSEGRSINKQLEMFVDSGILDYAMLKEHLAQKRKASLDIPSSRET